MTHISTSSRSTTGRIVRTLVALSIALAPFAIAEDKTEQQEIDTVVATAINFSITTSNPVTLTPLIGSEPVSDSSTQLAFDTNDGSDYKITVVAVGAGWTFAPTVAENVSNTFPVLRFVSATATAGTQVGTAAPLINADNSTPGAVDVVTGIKSASGTATVTLDASITQTVVAGTYSTTLTYAFFTY